jgi:carbon-monoxide dehydrogenase large subunit
VANAVANALRSFGAQPRQLPLTPSYVWELVQNAQPQAAE